MTETKPARYVEKYVTFHPDGKGGWDVFTWGLGTPPSPGLPVYMIRVEVPRELWDRPEAVTTVKAVDGEPPETAAVSIAYPSEKTCYSCGENIRSGIDVLRWDGDKPRHAYLCPGGKRWTEDNGKA